MIHPQTPNRQSPQTATQLSIDPNALTTTAAAAGPRAAGLLATVLASTSLASSNVVKALPLVGGLVALALLAIKLPGAIARGGRHGSMRGWDGMGGSGTTDGRPMDLTNRPPRSL